MATVYLAKDASPERRWDARLNTLSSRCRVYKDISKVYWVPPAFRLIRHVLMPIAAKMIIRTTR